MLLRPHPKDPSPHGFCPYHDGCLEGMACGKAMQQRWGVPARELPPDHIAWEIEAEYLAQMCVNTTVMLSPKRIVLGGGVMHQEHLFPMVRKRALEILNGYVVIPPSSSTSIPTSSPGIGQQQRRHRFAFAGGAGAGVAAWQKREI